VRTVVAGSVVTATVARTQPTTVPLAGLLVPDVELVAAATFRVESR
jgi:hypothetical protein